MDQTSMPPGPAISFGIIVLNGEPFLRYNLRALYPFAHQIIVVEGASPNATHAATADGHSTDQTLDILRRFKAEEDPQGKLLIVTAEDEGHPNGFWPGEKDQQSQAYARRATGDWLWQIDVDEFYQPEDMAWVMQHLLTRPDVTAVSFKQIPFWGSLDWQADGWYLRYGNGREFHRLFRWGPGHAYATHRPPTVLDQRGVDLRRIGWVQAETLVRRSIYLYHYSLLFPRQVLQKSRYYSSLFGHNPFWARQSYDTLQRPYRVHNVDQYPSWLERYTGTHPPQALAMWEDLRAGMFGAAFPLRQTTDIERIDATFSYRLGRMLLRLVGRYGFFTQLAVTKAVIVSRAILRKLLRRRAPQPLAAKARAE
jgi:glycosyltransferase involved in cell wall biosynthesis